MLAAHTAQTSSTSAIAIVATGPERQAFEKFLLQVRALMQQKGISAPAGFISYAWELSGSQELNNLQTWLTQLKKDFGLLGIELFLDIENMNGNMRECMRLIDESDFVLLIGTPRFKQRVEQDSLYLLPSFKFELIPKRGNAVILVENQDIAYFMEDGKLLGEETTISRMFDLSKVEWMQEVGYKRAKLSKAANSIIEEAIHQISERNISNAAFEFGLALDKLQKSPNALIPILYQGDLETTFPKDVLTGILIRSCKDPENYYKTFAALSPLGFIPALCPVLQKDADYQCLVQEFLGWNFSVWQAEAQQRPLPVELKLYVPSRGDISQDCSNPKPMEEHIQDFLKQKAAKVLLLLGGSGSGKSMFGQYLAYHLARNREEDEVIPLWISLPGLKEPKTNAITEGLGLHGVPEAHFELFKQKPLLIILDAYDEVKDLGNLYDSNHLERYNAKVIITCRQEFLTTKNLDAIFKPRSGSALWKRHMVPFSPAEINAYIEKYVELQNPIWDLGRYQTEINRLPVIKELIQTPFLLSIVADVLPDIVEGQPDLMLTRRALYEKFIDQWFLKHINRWQEQYLEGSNKTKLDLLDEGLNLDEDSRLEWNDKRVEVLRTYAETLAHKLYSAQIDAISTKANYPWVKELFDSKPRPKLIRSACPLKKTGEDSFGFIHKSLLEYLVTPQMVQQIQDVTPQITQQIQNNTTVMDPKIQNTQEHAPAPALFERLNEQLLLPAVIQFLADAILENPALQTGLWSIINSSKQNPATAIAAANAITVLNKARISFSGRDLRDICIPGADLSFALLDNTNLERADLSNVILKGAWLHGANFKDALMAGIIFAEYPALLLKSRVESCCYSPDGNILAVATGRNIELYDALTQRCLRVLEGHTDGVKCVAFSPDGNLLASAGDWNDGALKLWYVDTGELKQTLEGHGRNGDPIYSVAFSLDGKLLASGGSDNMVKLWQVEDGALRQTLIGHTKSVYSVAFSPDGKLLASGGCDNMVKLWQVEDGTLRREFFGRSEFVRCMSFSPDGRWLALGGPSSIVTLWQVEDCSLWQRLDGHTHQVNSVTFSQDGRWLASGSYDNTARLWQVDSGELKQTFAGHTREVSSVVFSIDSKWLASGSLDGTVKFWQVDSDDAQLLQKQNSEDDSYVKSVASSPDGMCLASGSLHGTIKLWQVRSGELQLLQHQKQTLEYGSSVNSVTFSPDGKWFALAGGRYDFGSVNLWGSGEVQPQTFEGHKSSVNSIAFSPDGKLLASGDSYPENKIKLWQVDKGELLQTLTDDGSVECVAFSPDGKTLASSGGFTVKLWHVGTGKLKQKLEGHNGSPVCSVAFSLDGKWLASGSCDDKVKLWQVDKGELLKTLEDGNSVSCVMFSPDGKWLASGGSKLIMRACAALGLSKEPSSYATNLTSVAEAICFRQSHEDSFLLSGHRDSNLRYWHLVTNDSKPYLQLLWTTGQSMLFSQGAYIGGVKGLSDNNLALLKQRGAHQGLSG